MVYCLWSRLNGQRSSINVQWSIINVQCQKFLNISLIHERVGVFLQLSDNQWKEILYKNKLVIQTIFYYAYERVLSNFANRKRK